MAEIYDTSDARRQLALIKQQMDEAKMAQQKAIRGTLEGTQDSAKIWGEAQKTKLAEILAMKTPTGDKALYKMDPEYLKKGMIGRFLTPAAGKVTSILSSEKVGVDPIVGSEGVIETGVDGFSRAGMKLPDGTWAGSATAPAPGPQSMKDMVGKNLGKITGGLGVAAGLYSASQYDWDSDKNYFGKAGSLATTGLGIASLAGVPGLGWYILGAGALGLLDQV